MATIPLKVYPRIEAALVIATFRKDRPQLTTEGALWPLDSFTMARLADKSITEHPAEAVKTPVAAEEHPPAA